MTISRRDWLKGAGAATATAMLPLSGCDDSPPADAPLVCSEATDVLPPNLPVDTYSGAVGPAGLYAHGVASGDPLTTQVILWTRVDYPSAPGAVEVFYEMALDVDFTKRVAAGTVMTDETKDYTVKVDVTGLHAGRTYYYRFRCLGVQSMVGRTKTLPEDRTAHLRMAMCSCSNYAFGYFHAYRHIAERSDLDVVLHLGDYIYEYANGGAYPAPGVQLRQWEPDNEIVTLDDYRTRYKLYRRDADLQEAHRQHPWITTWDDHEIANDSWSDGASNHDPASEGLYADRKAAASQAMHEYLPIRGTSTDPMYRSFRFGDLAEVIFLDTRHEGRDEQDVNPDSPTRQLLGATQEAWLADQLAASTSRWKILAQQVMVAPFSIDPDTHKPFFTDQWDGYPAARQRLYDMIEQYGGGNVVVLTGDIHGSFAAELPRDPWATTGYDPLTGDGALAVEFVCPGISSPGFSTFFSDLVLESCPHMKYAEWSLRGYVVLDIQRSKVQADWYLIDGIGQTQGVQSLAASYAVYDQVPRLVQMAAGEADKVACPAVP